MGWRLHTRMKIVWVCVNWLYLNLLAFKWRIFVRIAHIFSLFYTALYGSGNKHTTNIWGGKYGNLFHFSKYIERRKLICFFHIFFFIYRTLLFARAFNELYTYNVYIVHRTHTVYVYNTLYTIHVTRTNSHTQLQSLTYISKQNTRTHTRYAVLRVSFFLPNLTRENKTDSFYKVSTKYGKAQRAWPI